MKNAALLFAIWWLIIQTFALGAFMRVRLAGPDEAYTWTSQIAGVWPVPWQSFVALHAHFDSSFYIAIADQGYSAERAAFFPLYPLVIRAVWKAGCALLQQCDLLISAFVVSNLSALGAALALYQLARLDFTEAQARAGLFYVLIFPTAFFLTVNYSEALFVLLAAASFYMARRQRWSMAVGLGMGAMLTRASGFCLFCALLVEWQLQRGWRDWRWLGLWAMPMSFVAFEAYLRGQGFSFFATEQALFGRGPLGILALPNNLDWEYVLSHGAAQVNFLFDMGLGLFSLSMSVACARRWRLSYGVYGVLCVLLPLWSGLTQSLGRYTLSAFVAPLALAQYHDRPWVDRAYTLTACVWLALDTLLFVQGYWAG